MGTPCNWMLEDISVGDHIDAIIDVFSFADPGEQVVIGKLWPCGRPVRVVGPCKVDGAIRCVSLVNAVVRNLQGVITLACELNTAVLPLMTPSRIDLSQIIELCSGIGIGTYGFVEAGFQPVVAVDHSQALCDLYKVQHPNVQVICGSIGNSQIIVDVHHACPNASVLMSGFSCQPFSSGGLQQGAADSRSGALHDTLVFAKTLRCRVVMLECVPGAANNRFVRHQLESFSAAFGYHLNEVVLKLDHAWCAIFFCCERLSASMARSLRLELYLYTAVDSRPGPGGSRTTASCQP